LKWARHIPRTVCHFDRDQPGILGISIQQEALPAHSVKARAHASMTALISMPETSRPFAGVTAQSGC
jgi:hypothetical protein